MRLELTTDRHPTIRVRSATHCATKARFPIRQRWSPHNVRLKIFIYREDKVYEDNYDTAMKISYVGGKLYKYKIRQ